MSVFRVIAQNTISQGLGKGITLLFSLLTTFLLTRFLGVEGYGTYTFITAFVLLFGTASDWGTNIIAVREASQRKEQRAKIFGSITLFRFILAIAAFGLLNIVIRVRPQWEGFVLPATIASFVLLAVSLKTSLNIVFHTLLRFEKSALVEIFSSVLFFSFVSLTLLSGGSLNGVLFSWVLATFFAVALSLFLSTRIARISWEINKEIVRKVFWEALPAGALFLVFSVYNRIDTIILQHFQGEEAVGIYGLSYKIHDNLVLGAAFLMNSMFPLFSEKFASFKTSASDLTKLYQKAFDLLFIGGLVVAGGSLIFAPLIIGILAGAEFASSVLVLRILAFATFISYFNHLTGYCLIAFGRQRASLVIAVLALVFNVAANWILIPLFSFQAAAVITIATEGLVLVLSTIVIWKTIGSIPSPVSFPKTLHSLIKTRGKSL